MAMISDARSLDSKESYESQTPPRSSSLEIVAGSDEDSERSIMEPIGDSHPKPPIVQYHGPGNHSHTMRPPFYMSQGPPQVYRRPYWFSDYGPDFRSIPFRPPPFQPLHVYYCPPMPMVDPVPVMIVKQIDYYFSECNLARDGFLSYNMDSEGWVPISVIANFPRVKRLNRSIPFIIGSLRASNVVESKENNIRKRDNWRYWIPPPCPSKKPD